MDELSGKNKSVNKSFFLLDLEEIASWQNVTKISEEKRSEDYIIAQVPSLQRGAIWKPAQDELLWDSIFRGFPIGAFVVCKKLAKEIQNCRPGKYDDPKEQNRENLVTHNLLDGQQRANTIALGFLDPMTEKEPRLAVLWIDLNPNDEIREKTRSFLFRIITKAHPWGYGYPKDNDIRPLPAKRIRKALEDFGWQKDNVTIINREEWKLTDSWPVEANIPIPFAWLIKDTKKSDLDDPKAYWARVRNRCNDHIKFKWAKHAVNFLDNSEENAVECQEILSGLRHALNLRIVIFEVSEEILKSASSQENKFERSSTSDTPPKENITNVENLFQRLNAGGTQLEGEELSYSMIKAYWPGVENTIEKLAEKRMPASRLVMLAARTALANNNDQRFPFKLSVSTLRRIINERSKYEEWKSIESFIFSKGKQKAELEDVLKIISAWLEIDKTIDFGLPPVLHTSIARFSPDAYLLLMILAKNAMKKIGKCEDVINQTSFLRKRLIGLSTALHWFGADKFRSVSAIYKELDFSKPFPKDGFFNGLLKKNYKLEEGRTGVYAIPSPEELKNLISVPYDKKSLEDWQWWGQARKENHEQPEYWAVQCIKGLRELLLYAQREYLQNQFREYDPARQDLWQEHNRPWDFDHILASSKFYYKPSVFSGVKQWGYCIANLRAWPMEENRSDQDDPPITKLNSPKVKFHSFIEDKEVEGFQFGFENIKKPENAIAFISSAKDRLIRIYQAWYDTLGIGFLTNDN